MNKRKKGSKMDLSLVYFLTVFAICVTVCVFMRAINLKISRNIRTISVSLLLKLTLRTASLSLMTELLLICFSCRHDAAFDDPFYAYYKPGKLSSFHKVSLQEKSLFKLTLSANMMPVSVFCRVLSDRFNVGVVVSESLFDKVITAEFKDAVLTDVFNAISRQLDTDLVRVGNTFFIGNLRSQDRGILVRKVLGFSNQDLLTACKGVLSDKGKVSVVGAGIVSATDTESCIVRLSELLDYLSSCDSPLWILQLAFITINKDIILEGGLKLSTSGTLSYNVTDNEFKLKDINIDGIINSALSSSFADVYASPMVLCREGSQSVWKYGKRIPVPKKTTSSYGVVTTSDFSFIDVGLNLKARISRSHTGGILELEIGKSDIDSYVEYCPVIAQNTYVLVTDMVPLRPYLLGELSIFKDLNTHSDFLNFGKTKGKSSVQVWAQIYPIIPELSRRFPGKSSPAGP